VAPTYIVGSGAKTMTNCKDWHKIENGEALRLSQAEFKGMTIQALQDIRDDIAEIKDEMKTINSLAVKNQNEISKAKGYAAGLGAAAGLLVGFFKDQFLK
tara:strand:+ start:269 stop:568 length:300 start_codon:yes stop_codon:yes gene_type:complete